MPNMGKVLLTVQVYSIGITSDAKNGPTLITYSDVCHYIIFYFPNIHKY